METPRADARLRCPSARSTSARQGVSNLSRGQRDTRRSPRRAPGTKVVLLDQPTAALARPRARQALDLVRSLADQGLGVVIISDNMVDVSQAADRIVAVLPRCVTAASDRQPTTTTPGRRADHRGPLGIHGHRPRRAGPDPTEAWSYRSEPPPTPVGGFALDERRTAHLPHVLKLPSRRRRDLGARPATAALIAPSPSSSAPPRTSSPPKA